MVTAALEKRPHTPQSSKQMEPTQQPGETSSQAAPGGSAYLWEPPGSNASAYIDFDVVDRLGFEVMRGFGAVPRRGAEVGGILLGAAEEGERLVIRIEDFAPVECEHSRGPSYLLSERELADFDDVLARNAPAPDKRLYAIGYYRSNTRDALALAKEDIDLLDSRFPAPSAVCLLIKPYATRVSEAALLLRGGGFTTEPVRHVFPFRRKELGGGKSPRRTVTVNDEAARDGAAQPGPAEAAREEPFAPAAGTIFSAPAVEQAHSRTGSWIWIPLAFIFLLLGVAIGFQIAASYKERVEAGRPTDPYLLDLSVIQFGENLHLKWNLDAPVFRTAKRALLSIEDGENSKTLELVQEDLNRGGVLYKNSTGQVQFRLEVFPREQTSVSETVEVRLAPPARK